MEPIDGSANSRFLLGCADSAAAAMSSHPVRDGSSSVIRPAPGIGAKANIATDEAEAGRTILVTWNVKHFLSCSPPALRFKTRYPNGSCLRAEN